MYYAPVDGGDEYVRVRALGRVDFTGWTVVDEKEHRFALPAIHASVNQIVTVPNSGGAAWNNDGDTAYLYNSGGTLMDTHSYKGGKEGVCE